MIGGTRRGREKVGIVGIGLLFLAVLPGCAMLERITHDPWLSFAFKVLNFAILMVILIKVLSKPLGNFLKNRQAKVRQTLEDAKKARAQAEERMQDYERRLAQIDKEIAEILDTLREEGQREKARIIRAAEEQAEKIKEQARATAQQEVQQAQRILREETAGLAVKLAEDILKKTIADSDHKRLVEEYVDQMGTVP